MKIVKNFTKQITRCQFFFTSTFAYVLPACLLFYTIPVNSFVLTAHQEQHDNNAVRLTIHVKPAPHELIYQDKILLSVDHPDIILSPYKIHNKPTLSYDPQLHENVQVFNKNFTIKLTVTQTHQNTSFNTAHLHVTMASNQHNAPQEELILLKFSTEQKNKTNIQEPTQISKKTALSSCTTSDTTQKNYIVASHTESVLKKISTLKNNLQNKFSSTESIALKLLLAFLLGLLLSMTPCIYPMIPITAGLLQASAGNSLIKNFLLALCYALGLGTTFALMGLIAASSGQALGHIMLNPFFVIALVLFLSYFAFSLFGFYNLYIPRFMQHKTVLTKTNSPLSIFLFGMGSGSVASPCVSPGLALILANVATLANKFLGFLLLFCFGFGISTPLIIVGTFSSSLAILPQSGMWMIEIQKIFGFMLLGMCFYYVSNILPWFIILCMLSVFFAIMGMYYLRSITPDSGRFSRLFKNFVGMGSLIAAVFIASQAVQEFYYPETKQKTTLEHNTYTDYTQAVHDAQEQKKLLFLDFWTPYCSICKEINKKIIENPAIQSILHENYIFVSIDASDNQQEPYKTLREKYTVWGVPNIFVIDPSDEKILKHWQSELYEASVNHVAQELTSYYKNTYTPE